MSKPTSGGPLDEWKAPTQPAANIAPDANAYAVAWIGSFKRECLNHFLCFSRGHLDHVAQEYTSFYNAHRPHQGLGNRTVAQAARGRRWDAH